MHVKLKIFIKIFTLLWILSCSISASLAQGLDNIGEFNHHPLIRTILLHRSGWDLSVPVISLAEEEELEFRFDYLNEPGQNFSYAIDACTYDWKPSSISEHEYLEGFNDVSMYDYEPSRNTTQYFTHYLARIPNEELKIIHSGNYRLRVYDSSMPDSILISRRFAVLDQKVEITGRVNKPDYENQELEIRVNLKNLPVSDPFEEIKVVVIKNYDWNNRVAVNSRPVYRNGMLHFNMPGQIEARGGNEFRQVDTKDTRFISNGVENIEYRAPHFVFILKPENLKQYDPYFSEKDLNGRSFYEIPDARDRHLDADYVKVIFRLRSEQALGSDVYIYGALTDWETDTANYMIYQPDEGYYERELLLKQGLLNYAYTLRDFNTSMIDFNITEGNHSETENDYLVFVYYRGITDDYDELVGYEVINSQGKTE
ncbi:MAG: DUF5103 domain-containing protein [Bacteroidales bacterium]|nr:DUF5103 domain-containing protein [Bacteroidales bacterium]